MREDDWRIVESWQHQVMQLSRDGTIIIFGGRYTPLVTIHPDGAIEPGDGYTPDKAARGFWDAIALIHPGFRRERRAPDESLGV